MKLVGVGGTRVSPIMSKKISGKTLLNTQLSVGPKNITVGMLEKLRKETQIWTKLPTSHCCSLRAHVVE